MEIVTDGETKNITSLETGEDLGKNLLKCISMVMN
jgi:hypothetical protein